MRKPDWANKDLSVQLYLGDCRKLLPQLNFDAVVTDFPYCVVRTGACDFSLKLYLHDIAVVTSALQLIDSFNPFVPVITFASPDFTYPGYWTSCGRWSDPNGQLQGHSYHNILSARCRVDLDYSDKSETEYHPYQKPLPLMSSLISIASRRGSCVLDPFMGSGTTGVACALTERRFIGIEADPSVFEVAVRRLESV